MTIIEQVEKIEYLNYLIRQKNTGSAKELSVKLGVSKNTIHRLLEAMRNLGCPISYCITQKTYYYETDGNICLKFQEYKLEKFELHRINGGKIYSIPKFW